jgi:two-component system, OmpR family, sensor kinase
VNRLWVRLAVAFALVTLVTVALAAILAYRTVGTDFRRYLAHAQMMGLDDASGPGAALLAQLAHYHGAHGDWTGVEGVFAAAGGTPDATGRGMGGGMGRGMGRGGPSYILADADGRIVFDGAGGGTVGQRLANSDRDEALTVGADGTTVGYLLIRPPGRGALTVAAQSFLTQVTRSLVQAGLLAGLFGVLLGLVIARGLVAPLDRLAAGTRRIARGHLGERVPVEGADEVAAVSLAFNEMAAHLQHAEALRAQMVADIAHELRTPLTVVQGNLRAILDDVYPLDKAEVATIYDETLMLARLVDDLRELARAEAGQLDLHPCAVDLAALAHREVESFAESARGGGVNLGAVAPDALPEAWVDPDRVRQVLHNLLANALRYTPSGGVIEVRVELADDLVAADGVALLRVIVNDTGTGIEPADLPHVFDRFWRADPARSRSQGGSGLGLAIARQIVEAHGGRIAVDSAPGAGSRFWFTVPTSPRRQSPTGARNAEVGSRIG